jgi:hypothetical protein
MAKRSTTCRSARDSTRTQHAPCPSHLCPECLAGWKTNAVGSVRMSAKTSLLEGNGALVLTMYFVRERIQIHRLLKVGEMLSLSGLNPNLRRRGCKFRFRKGQSACSFAHKTHSLVSKEDEYQSTELELWLAPLLSDHISPATSWSFT